MTKRKDERRELLKEDEIHSFLDKLAHKIQEDPTKYFGGLAAFLVVLAAIFFFFDYRESAAKQEAAALFTVTEILGTDIEDKDAELQFDSETAKFEAALTELNDILSSHSGAVAQQARIFKVQVLQDLGRYEEVEAIYREIIAKGGGFQIFGQLGIADIAFAKGDYDLAMSEYNKLTNMGGKMPDLSDWVAYKLALCYKEKGESSEALNQVNMVLDKYGTDLTTAPPVANLAKTLKDELEEEAGEAEAAANS